MADLGTLVGGVSQDVGDAAGGLSDLLGGLGGSLIGSGLGGLVSSLFGGGGSPNTNTNTNNNTNQNTNVNTNTANASASSSANAYNDLSITYPNESIGYALQGLLGNSSPYNPTQPAAAATSPSYQMASLPTFQSPVLGGGNTNALSAVPSAPGAPSMPSIFPSAPSTPQASGGAMAVSPSSPGSYNPVQAAQAALAAANSGSPAMGTAANPLTGGAMLLANAPPQYAPPMQGQYATDASAPPAETAQEKLGSPGPAAEDEENEPVDGGQDFWVPTTAPKEVKSAVAKALSDYRHADRHVDSQLSDVVDDKNKRLNRADKRKYLEGKIANIVKLQDEVTTDLADSAKKLDQLSRESYSAQHDTAAREYPEPADRSDYGAAEDLADEGIAMTRRLKGAATYDAMQLFNKPQEHLMKNDTLGAKLENLLLGSGPRDQLRRNFSAAASSNLAENQKNTSLAAEQRRALEAERTKRLNDAGNQLKSQALTFRALLNNATRLDEHAKAQLRDQALKRAEDAMKNWNSQRDATQRADHANAMLRLANIREAHQERLRQAEEKYMDEKGNLAQEAMELNALQAGPRMLMYQGMANQPGQPPQQLTPEQQAVLSSILQRATGNGGGAPPAQAAPAAGALAPTPGETDAQYAHRLFAAFGSNQALAPFVTQMVQQMAAKGLVKRTR